MPDAEPESGMRGLTAQAHTEVNGQFNGRAGIDAAERDSQRMLPLRPGADLAAEVSGEARCCRRNAVSQRRTVPHAFPQTG